MGEGCCQSEKKEEKPRMICDEEKGICMPADMVEEKSCEYLNTLAPFLFLEFLTQKNDYHYN